MKTQHFFLSLATLMMLIFAACNSEGQNTTQAAANSVTTKIEVIQFHSEHRCMTCNTIETLTKQTLESYPSMNFSLVNVDDAKNEKQAEEFEAAGTALFLYNPATGKKKELTDFAFMNAHDEDKFIAGLKGEIEGFVR